jgi:hypothetical protein
MIILQNFTKKSQTLNVVLYDWIEFDCSEFTNQSSFQSNSDSYIDWVENTWLIMKAMNISIDTLNCLTQKMNEFERQQIQSSQYWVWICDLWTFYHLFWNNMWKKNTFWLAYSPLTKCVYIVKYDKNWNINKRFEKIDVSEEFANIRHIQEESELVAKMRPQYHKQ